MGGGQLKEEEEAAPGTDIVQEMKLWVEAGG